jgi:F-type H+-transporting ATPase subunit b
MIAFVLNLAEDTEEPSGLDLFIPKPAEIFWSALCVLIIAVAFYKFLLPKLNNILESRAEKIEGELVNAAQIKQEAEEMHEKYSEEVKHAKLDASEIRDEARSQANQIVSDARVKAQNEVNLITRNAQRAIESERKAAEVALKKEVGSIAMSITQKMLTQGVNNNERQDRFIDNAIDSYAENAGVEKPKRDGRKNQQKSHTNNVDNTDEAAKPTAKPRVRKKINLEELDKPKANDPTVGKNYGQ